MKDNKEKLTANILFSGIGCQERGFYNSNVFDLEVINTSEINKDSVLSYAAIHCGLTDEFVSSYKDYPSRKQMADELTAINLGYNPEKEKPYNWYKFEKSKKPILEKYWLACKLSKNLGDISKIKELPYADFWTCSFPCFTADTLVLTKNGYLPIKDIKVNMEVLTHTNTYKKVMRSAKTGEKNIYKITTDIGEIECTENHQFYVKNYDDANSCWKECRKLTKNDFLGYAINQNNIPYKYGKTGSLSTLMNNPYFWWIIGRYLATPVKTDKVILFHKSYSVLKQFLTYCGFSAEVINKKKNWMCIIDSQELYDFVKKFENNGELFLPSFIFDMPVEYCKAFLKGYFEDEFIHTYNKGFAYGLLQLFAKSYHDSFKIVKNDDKYSIIHDDDPNIFYKNGCLWYPIISIENTHEIKSVYDITVEEDHSFTANGMIAHNCTDISVAGKMKGLNPDSGTRSSLLWQNINLLKIAKSNDTLPKYIMFENVKNLVGKKFKKDFDNLLTILDELGFNSYWKVLNGKDCGIPQNRERVFIIAIRKNVDTHKFTFPIPYDTGIRLKDILEKKVDKRYYLKQETVDKFKLLNNEKVKNIVNAYIKSKEFGVNEIVQLGHVNNSQDGRIISQNGLSNTLVSGHGNVPKIIENKILAIGQVSNDGSQGGKVYHPEGIMPTICAGTHGYAIGNIIVDFKIRKLTPKECFRLMGFTYEDCEHAQNIGISETQLYKQTGNGIITNCCQLLAEHLYKAQYNDTYICTDENFLKPQVD